jgi:hypothetical protein
MPKRNKQHYSVVYYRTVRTERARLEKEYAALIAEVSVARAKKSLAATKPKAGVKKAAKRKGFRG